MGKSKISYLCLLDARQCALHAGAEISLPLRRLSVSSQSIPPFKQSGLVPTGGDWNGASETSSQNDVPTPTCVQPASDGAGFWHRLSGVADLTG